jgi:hypothetical protein
MPESRWPRAGSGQRTADSGQRASAANARTRTRTRTHTHAHARTRSDVRVRGDRGAHSAPSRANVVRGISPPPPPSLSLSLSLCVCVCVLGRAAPSQAMTVTASKGRVPLGGVARICSKPHHPPCRCLASPAWRTFYFVVGKRQLGWLGKHSILVVLAGLDSLDGLAVVHFAKLVTLGTARRVRVHILSGSTHPQSCWASVGETGSADLCHCQRQAGFSSRPAYTIRR